MQIEETPGPLLTCAYSGVSLPASRMVQIGEHWIADDQKDACVQFLQQGGVLPVLPADGAVAAPPPRLIPVWAEAWRIFIPALPAMLFMHLVIWLPGDLLSAYMSYEVFGGEEIGRSLRFDNALQLWIGILAEAGCLHALASVWRGRRAGPGEVLAAGFRHWPRMWLMSFLWRLAAIAGLLLLIIPGIIVMVRFVFASCYIVDDGRRATESLGASFRLAKGHFWRILGLVFLTTSITLLPMFVLGMTLAFMPEEWNVWPLDAVLTWLGEIPMLFVPAVVYVLWQSLRQASAPGTAD